MSFETETKVPVKRGILSLFGSDASEEARAINRRAAKLSMDDMAAVMNAANDTVTSDPGKDKAAPTSTKDQVLLNAIAKVGIQALMQEKSSDSHLKHLRTAVDPSAWQAAFERGILSAPRAGLLPFNVIQRALDEGDRLTLTTQLNEAIRRNPIRSGYDLLEKLGQELEILQFENVDLEDITFSVSYRNPASNRLETKVLNMHDEHSEDPLGRFYYRHPITVKEPSIPKRGKTVKK